MTVWIYVDTSKEVGDVDQLKVFATDEAAAKWLAEKRPGRGGVQIRGSGVNRIGTIECRKVHVSIWLNVGLVRATCPLGQ